MVIHTQYNQPLVTNRQKLQKKGLTFLTCILYSADNIYVCVVSAISLDGQNS